MTVYLQEAGKFRSGVKRPAVLVLPGGGYQYCSEREADPVALSYLKAGFQAFILRYSVGEDAVWPNPLDDYEQAMGLIRERAEEWNLYQDKIAVVGFSAGGHLAAAAAVMGVNRPNAAVLGYAVTGTGLLQDCAGYRVRRGREYPALFSFFQQNGQCGACVQYHSIYAGSGGS